MLIGETYYNCNLSDVLDELAVQLQANGIQLLQKRKNLQTHIQVQCPYHAGGQESRPSAGIRKSDGIFHCFACGQVHSLPEVISFCFGKDDDLLGKFGSRWLVKNFTHLEVEKREPLKLDMSRDRHISKPKYVSEIELDRYRYTHNYLYERGMTDEIIEIFDLGYDKATQSITFPVRDIAGNTLFVARRNIRYKRYQYPEGVTKPLYGIYELQQAAPKDLREIIVCEGMFDALSCWVYGKYAVALNGLGNDLQVKQLRESPYRKIILALDMDQAGLDGRRKLKEKLDNKIVTEYRWDLNKSKDINSMSREQFQDLQEKL